MLAILGQKEKNLPYYLCGQSVTDVDIGDQMLINAGEKAVLMAENIKWPGFCLFNEGNFLARISKFLIP
jgi:hypothetical protein